MSRIETYKIEFQFTFRSAVYVALISSLFSVYLLFQLSNKNTVFSVVLQTNVPSICSHYSLVSAPSVNTETEKPNLKKFKL